MILRTAYVRFYRAFNFDYLRKQHPDAQPDPWDQMEDNTFYPYVSLDIDRELTAIVGANESGKSQFLEAIECALGNKCPTPADFCRYSDYFTVSKAMMIPHFGLHFEGVTSDEAEEISELIEPSDASNISSFRVFRTSADSATLYIDDQHYEINDLAKLAGFLPKVFRIDPARAIPNSVPISFLIDRDRDQNANPGLMRTDRLTLLDSLLGPAQDLSKQMHDPQGFSQKIQSFLSNISAPTRMSERETEAHCNQLNLAFDLLVTVGGIHVSAFVELQKALRNDDEGLANGIVATMNSQLERSLNLSKWWSQDHQFRLAIAVRDFDIVFTIRDRTGSEYSFAERSSGLKYFLSYLVQFLAHVRDRSGSEILLMDEPDAYLSNQGQQDLLRVLHEFTLRTETAPGGQVVFVTHSPFLIDKNRADRIRVLDKGSGEEGVRVVRDVGRNHFEPLRTALGSFVGETAFIGNCNLMLEGLADQVYLAGMSDLLGKANFASTHRLDLNRITLVPAGSASHVPYMTFLARGRDANKPAVIVLLDGDEEGDRAVKALKRGGPRNKQLIRDEYVAQLKPNAIDSLSSDRCGGPLEIEDLIPVEIAIEAAKKYLREMDIKLPEEFPEVGTIKESLSESTGVFKAIQKGLDKAGSELRLEKLGFARHVLDVCAEGNSEAANKMRSRFAALFFKLTAMQRKAEREREQESIEARVDREKALFLKDRLSTATKADVVVLLERIEAIVDTSVEGDALLTEIRRIRDDLDLNRDLNGPIDSKDLKNRLERLKYAEVLASQPEAWSN